MGCDEVCEASSSCSWPTSSKGVVVVVREGTQPRSSSRRAPPHQLDLDGARCRPPDDWRCCTAAVQLSTVVLDPDLAALAGDTSTGLISSPRGPARSSSSARGTGLGAFCTTTFSPLHLPPGAAARLPRGHGPRALLEPFDPLELSRPAGRTSSAASLAGPPCCQMSLTGRAAAAAHSDQPSPRCTLLVVVLTRGGASRTTGCTAPPRGRQ